MQLCRQAGRRRSGRCMSATSGLVVVPPHLRQPAQPARNHMQGAWLARQAPRAERRRRARGHRRGRRAPLRGHRRRAARGYRQRGGGEAASVRGGPRGVACREGGRLALLCRLTTCLSGHCDTLTLSVCRVGPSACLASAACGAPRALGAWMGARCPASLPLPIALVTVSAGRGIHLP